MNATDLHKVYKSDISKYKKDSKNDYWLNDRKRAL